MDTVKEHYRELAHECGSSPEMSMKDHYVRETEINEIGRYIGYLIDKYGSKKILEIGCGNGYTAERISEGYMSVDIVGIDFCEELIDIAKDRKLKRVEFQVSDVKDLRFENETFDIVYSERCLITLMTWTQQKKALDEVHRVLKSNGIYIMIESFTDGLNEINDARKSVGLHPITQPFHNNYFNKDKLLQYIHKKKWTLLDSCDSEFKSLYSQNFMSSYYFGSRVLYPALVKDGKIEYNNKFIEFFTYLKPYGNYSYTQALVLMNSA